MGDRSKQNSTKTKIGEKQADREVRLAEALKVNLRRRKAQSRARSTPVAAKGPKRP